MAKETKKTKEVKEIIPNELLADRTIHTMDITITLHKDLKFCYVEKADEVRAKGFKEKKMNCHVNIKMVVTRGVDYREQQDMFLRIVGNYFSNDVNLSFEVK